MKGKYSTTYDSTVEAKVFQMVKVDKHRAFELVFDTFWKPLYKQACRKVQCADKAKDLTQEAFIVFWENFDKLTEGDKLLPYLYGVLRNKILKLFEKEEVRLRYAFNHSFTGDKFELSSDQLFLEKELSSIINKEVEKMPPRMREIYTLKKINYLSNKDIAEKLCLSEQTVKNQLQNAYQRLKICLKEYDSSSAILWILYFAIY